MKLLIFIPSPRDIPEFQEAIDKIKHDKIWAKYIGYPELPYPQAREFFLKHEEYTHFAICPDDMIPTVEGVEQLIESAEGRDYISAICNVGLIDIGELAITYNLPSKKTIGRIWDFYRVKDLPDKPGIIKVGWSGTPFAIMPRKVIEQLEFTGVGKWNDNLINTESFDVQIANDLFELGISEFVDTRVNFHHMRYGGKIQVGFKDPYLLWEHNGKKEKFKSSTDKRTGTVFDHPLYKQYDPLQFPEHFIRAGLPVERPPPSAKLAAKLLRRKIERNL